MKLSFDIEHINAKISASFEVEGIEMKTATDLMHKLQKVATDHFNTSTPKFYCLQILSLKGDDDHLLSEAKLKSIKTIRELYALISLQDCIGYIHNLPCIIPDELPYGEAQNRAHLLGQYCEVQIIDANLKCMK